MTELLRQARRTCRRRHKNPCFACGLPILPGDKYEEAAFAFEGSVYVIREHAVCRAETAAIAADWKHDDGYPQGVLADDPLECSEQWREWYFARKALDP